MDNFLFLPRSVAAALFDAAFAGALGLVIARLWLARDSDEKLVVGLRRKAVACAVAMVVGLCAQAYLSTATMIGSSGFAEVRAQFADVMTGTHAGRALLFSVAAALVALFMIPVGRMWQSRMGRHPC